MSLRLRLTLLNSLILVLVGGALVAAVYAILGQGLQRQIDDSLREQARLYSEDVSAWYYRDARRLPGPILPPPPPRGGQRTGAPGDTAGRPPGPSQGQVQPGPGLPDPGRPPGPGGPGGPFGVLGPPPGADGAAGPESLGPPELVVPIFRRFAGTSTFVQVVDADGKVEARSENLGVDSLPVPAEGLIAAREEREWLGHVVVEGQPLRLLVSPLRISRAEGVEPLALVLQVAQPLGAIERTLNALRTTILAVGAAGVVIAIAAGWMLARTALTPIDRLAQVADAIGAARDFGQRVPVPDRRPDEIGRLGMAFNRMLGELQGAHETVAGALVAQRRFVADASHELRTPLATLRGNVDLLRQMLADAGADDAAEAAILDDVSTEAERMGRLVADLLLLAQADAGQHLTLRPTDLTAVAHDAARAARLLRDEVQVGVTLPADAVWVQGHADRLRQVLMILLDNAVKHAPSAPSGGRVALTVDRSRSGGADGVAVTVTDNGPGITVEAQPRIFERFYRAPGARSGEGTGLGLAIARWIVEEHGGSLSVASVPGQGAAFTLWLPTIAPPSGALGSASEATEAILADTASRTASPPGTHRRDAPAPASRR